MIYTIAQHEFLKLFKTRKIWQLLAFCQCILGFVFYHYMNDFLIKSENLLFEKTPLLGITEEVVHPLFAWTALLFFLITPLLANHTLTQEKKSQTLYNYLNAPIKSHQIILGKFIGMFLGQLFLLLPVLLMPLLIAVEDSLDIGQFISSLLGLMLLQMCSLSLGFLIATLTKEPVITVFLIFISFIFATLIEWLGQRMPASFEWVSALGLLYHCKNFLSGILNTQAILYYGLMTFVFLVLSIYRLEKESYFRGKT